MTGTNIDDGAVPPDVPAPAQDHHGHGGEALTAAVEAALRHHLHDHLIQVEHLVANGRRAVARCTGDHHEHHLPAWLRPTEGEARWPVALAVLFAIGLQLVVPAPVAMKPAWLLPGVELVLLVLLVVANPTRINRDHAWLRVTSLVLVAVATVANAWSAARLVTGLIEGRKEWEDAGPLLACGAAIWLTNVIVFALWYWEFDRGGPVARAHARHPYPDFQFPQMATPDTSHHEWEPAFIDYLYLSFTNATAFSPTDTLPFSRWAKLTMLTQSAVSLITVALVIARAVNILQ
ncbi:MAG TPA: hypothetical protein VF054_10565 [Micromonosporaceae bacterium]